MHGIRLIGNAKTLGMNVSMNCCPSLCVGPGTVWLPFQS